MAKAPTKKPVPPRAVVAPREKAVAAPLGGEASKPVEWPLDAARAKKTPVITKAPSKPEPVSKPSPAPVAEAAVQPVVPVAAAPIAEETVPPAPVAAEKTKGIMIMTEAMETAKTYAEEAKTRFQGAVSEMNEKAKAAVEKSAKAIEELGELTKGNFDAMVESSKIATKGIETMSQEAVEYGRKSFEKSTATFKSFAAVKSPAEFFQLQSELLSASLDTFASAAAKNSEAMLKLAGDVSKPISNRVAIVTDKVKSLAA